MDELDLGESAAVPGRDTGKMGHVLADVRRGGLAAHGHAGNVAKYWESTADMV